MGKNQEDRSSSDDEEKAEGYEEKWSMDSVMNINAGSEDGASSP